MLVEAAAHLRTCAAVQLQEVQAQQAGVVGFLATSLVVLFRG
jgi:hypothetical protein